MSARVRVRHHGDHLVAAKVAVDAGDEARLVREAAMLTVARCPGVVPLVGLHVGPDGLELLTSWMGTRSLQDARPFLAVHAAGVVGALASTVADLHRDGVVHGAIDPSHVLLDSAGRPVLCSFGRATTVAGASAPATRPSEDVAALGELLVALLGDPAEPELVPVRRFAARHDHHLHRSLLTLADHARAHDPTARPSAAALASALAQLDPSAESAGARAPRRWRSAVVGTAVGLGVAVSAGVADRMAASTTPPSPAPVTTPSAGAPAAAPVVDLAGRRYQLGEPGDLARVARWRCGSDEQVVLLRPRTGELFLFDAPASTGEPVSTVAFATVSGAFELRGSPTDEPCPALVVARSDGPPVSVEVPVR